MGPFDPPLLQAALAAVPGSRWSRPSSYAVTGVHHGNRRIVVVDAGRWLDEAEPFVFVLEAFAPVHTAWLSMIDPGGFIADHCDGGPWLERWQVPIRTAGWFQQDGVSTEAVDGVPFPVAHWACHAVGNPTTRPRVHLVIDRDVKVDRPPQPFAKYPPTQALTGLMERT